MVVNVRVNFRKGAMMRKFGPILVLLAGIYFGKRNYLFVLCCKNNSLSSSNAGWGTQNVFLSESVRFKICSIFVPIVFELQMMLAPRALQVLYMNKYMNESAAKYFLYQKNLCRSYF